MFINQSKEKMDHDFKSLKAIHNVTNSVTGELEKEVIQLREKNVKLQNKADTLQIAHDRMKMMFQTQITENNLMKH